MKATTLLLTLSLALSGAGGCSDDTKQPPPADLGKKDTKGPTGDLGTKTCGTTAFLPADAKIGDYKKTAAPQVAADGKALKDLIDGGSEKYEQNKFVCMSLVKYASAAKTTTIEIWVFDQTDAAGATAAMAAAASPDATATTPVLGDASDENLKLPFAYEARARKGKHLVRIYTDKKADGQADALALLKEVVAAMP